MLGKCRIQPVNKNKANLGGHVVFCLLLVSSYWTKGPFPMVRFNRRGWARVPYYPAFFKSMYHFHTRGTRAGGLPRGSIFSAPHGKNAWGIPENDVTQMAFPCIAACFAKFVKINLTWTYNHLIICKFDKRNPIFNTIKGGQEMCDRKFLRTRRRRNDR